MLRHPADREILRLAVPALGALAAEPLYVLVDTAVVGHLGTGPLGGLAIAATILTTGFVIFNFLAYGTTASVARSVGAGAPEAAARHAVAGVWVAAVIGGGLAVAGAALAPRLVGLFGGTADVVTNGVLYLRVSALGAPAVLLALVGVGYLRGVQDTRTTLAVALGSNLANLVLELVLIVGLGLGVGASALATVVAQYGAAAVYLRVVVRHVAGTAVGWRPDAARIRALLRVGSALVVRTGSLLGSLAVATAVASGMGDAPLGAHQVAFQIWNFLALTLDAVAIAGQAIVGRLLGAGDGAAARSSAARMVQWGVAAGVVFAVAVGGLRGVAGAVFTDDAAVRTLVGDVLVVVAVLQPLNAVVFVLDGVLIGAGDLAYLSRAMAASALFVFAPAAVAVAAADAGLLWLWGALASLMVARLGANLARFRSGAWAVVGPR